MKHSFQNQRRRSFLLIAGAGVFLAPLATDWFSANGFSIVDDNKTGLVISPEHLSCIRRLRFIWVPNVESGGPSVDFEAPFGSPNAYADLAKVAPAKSRPELKHLYAEVMKRLPVFTETAKLEPGSYVLPQPVVTRLKRSMADGDTGIKEDGSFYFTAEHAKLIAAIKWWYNEPSRFSFIFNLSLDPQDWVGGWRVATVNFKRPFGDMTYFEIDMARALGVDLKPNSKDPEEDRLFALYRQMHVALQVFVMHATL